MQVDGRGFLYCPVCGKKTKTKVLPSTELKRFPLFCPWCKRESVVEYSRQAGARSQS